MGLAALFIVFAYIAIDSANRSSKVILEERVTVAQMLATRIESAILASGNLVDSAASELSAVPEQAEAQRILDRLASNLRELNLQDNPAHVGLFVNSGELASSSPVGEKLSASLGEHVGQGPMESSQVARNESGSASIRLVRSIDSISASFSSVGVNPQASSGESSRPV